jgi:transposase InsO family protein
VRRAILRLVDEAVAAGARRAKAARLTGVSVRTIERWRRECDGGKDRRAGPAKPRRSALSEAERARVLAVATSPEYRDLPPGQIVPRLADRGEYVASESTVYRVLRASQMERRTTTRVAVAKRPKTLPATGPGQVWSWDITYLRAPIRGMYFRLYMILDVFSRKIVGWAVHESETAELAAELVDATAAREGVRPGDLTLHADNGGAQKGSTLMAKLEALGIARSFSRPRTSDDNPFSEAHFRTMKYRPEYPEKCFANLDAAQAWVARFVRWYNEKHLHSGISYVTPASRHAGKDREILERRRRVYEAARRAHPERWSGDVRRWERPEVVTLNPDRRDSRGTRQRAESECPALPSDPPWIEVPATA